MTTFNAEQIMDILPPNSQRAFIRVTYRRDDEGRRRKPLKTAMCKACQWVGDTRVDGSRTPTRQMIAHNDERHPR